MEKNNVLHLLHNIILEAELHSNIDKHDILSRTARVEHFQCLHCGFLNEVLMFVFGLVDTIPIMCTACFNRTCEDEPIGI